MPVSAFYTPMETVRSPCGGQLSLNDRPLQIKQTTP
jgi:hypothetical protein